jgi:peptidoglycan/xylan/chitin deacetylase (PgdA/CDA1 family)
VTLVPILLYHSISSDPIAMVRPYAIDEPTFGTHLDLIVARDLTALRVSDFLDATRRDDDALLARAVVITFDDGFADFASAALPALQRRGLTATLYVTTGFLRGGREPPVRGDVAEQMLEWSQLAELRDAGVEIGGHSHTHPQLDTLRERAAREEISRCTTLLEDRLGEPVRTFAYPHCYSSRRVRRLVRAAGYRGACGVKNTLSSSRDDEFALARLMIERRTTPDEIGRWLDRRGAPPPRVREAARTRLWRAYRRGRAVATRRAGVDPGWAA